MLLPRPVSKNEEDIDPRAELVRRLLEYEQMKLAGINLNELPQAERDFMLVELSIEQSVVQRLPGISVNDLRNAWLTLVTRAQANQHHRVTREELSVRAHMSRILRHLHGREFVEFQELFSAAAGVPEIVVTFLAILELSRESLVELTQPQTFGIIYVKSISLLTAA
jgi:segregation and condensation protein A